MHGNLTMLLVFLLACATEPERVARIMDVRGAVQIVPVEGPARSARPFDPLIAGNRLVIPRGGMVTLLFYESGTKQRVKEERTVTVAKYGCEPPEAVERLKSVSKTVAVTLRNLRSASGEEFASTTLRDSPRPKGAPAITPIDASTVISDRPNLVWKASSEAKKYRVRLSVGGSNRLLWFAESSEPRLAFPPKEPALRRGRVYLWQVSDEKGGSIASGRFTVATAPEAAKLDEFASLARSDDPADLLAAAAVFATYGVDDQAMPAYEKLVKLVPSEPLYSEVLGDVYLRAGRVDDAKKADEAAKARRQKEASRKPFETPR